MQNGVPSLMGPAEAEILRPMGAGLLWALIHMPERHPRAHAGRRRQGQDRHLVRPEEQGPTLMTEVPGSVRKEPAVPIIMKICRRENVRSLRKLHQRGKRTVKNSFLPR